jgi:hypothetical protein
MVLRIRDQHRDSMSVDDRDFHLAEIPIGVRLRDRDPRCPAGAAACRDRRAGGRHREALVNLLF